jgi:uncharacterized protein (DUF2336 family)
MRVQGEVTEQPRSGGRRREALLRRSAQEQPAQAITMQDVVQLQQDRSPDSRVLLATKLGSQLDELTAGGHHDLCAAILHLLVRDVEARVRQALAETVCHSPSLPSEIASRLARDAIEVARPILENSPVLTDEELIGVVRTNAMQYALAVAGRESVSEALADALIDTGEQHVVLRVVGNTGAKLSSQAVKRVAEDYRSDSEVQDRLVRRPELPYELVEQLVGVIGDRLEWELLQSRRITPEQARAILSATRERATISMVAREHGDQKMLQHLRERHAAGDLGHEDTIALLRDGDIGGFELSLSILSGLEPRRVRRLLYSGDRRYLAAFCIRADFPTPHYMTLRMALDLAEQCLAKRSLAKAYSADTMRFVQVQYERLRADPAKVEQLLQ